ncbi:hypothetical protein M569_11136 [Genlisea aurea]|uniref:WRKY domain-containing protein n=1 Tax=Genlisea aurea TaxID=192259 RepID=S8CA11_9LAMI|nr:hypothetical protein M569_11136 [Genlisea aurea]
MEDPLTLYDLYLQTDLDDRSLGFIDLLNDAWFTEDYDSRPAASPESAAGGPPRSCDESEESGQKDKLKTDKQMKPKKSIKKREREPRFAFMTKTEIDQLEDGYRWRKYGQKSVKNSPFPRSYYKCTTTSCNVKKRVERSCNDPTIVVTTYEGQHTHPVPPTVSSLVQAYSHPHTVRSELLRISSRNLLDGAVFKHDHRHREICFDTNSIDLLRDGELGEDLGRGHEHRTSE